MASQIRQERGCRWGLAGGLAVLVLAAVGCVRRPAELIPSISDGAAALRRVADPSEWPDLEGAFRARDSALLDALNRSLGWFDRRGRMPAYPFLPLGLTREQARAGVAAFREHLLLAASSGDFRARIVRDFDLYASVGSDGRGAVLFTGYYSPIFRGSRTCSGTYRYPLFGRPPDLMVEKGTDKVLGRDVGGRVEPYPARAEIERNPAALGLSGREIACLDSKLDAYLVHVQGSALLDLGDGGPQLQVGYAGSNGRDYTSLGKLLVEDGKIERGRANIPAIRAYFEKNPGELDSYLTRNERFIFFREEAPGQWPLGSLGVPVTPLRSLATDKGIFPPGGAVLVQTPLATADGGVRAFEQFMVDQDTGGAIRAPGRADIYVGTGAEAGEIAGRQAHTGRLFYFVLKAGRVAEWTGTSSRGGSYSAAPGRLHRE